jgi:hypothetical protein
MESSSSRNLHAEVLFSGLFPSVCTLDNDVRGGGRAREGSYRYVFAGGLYSTNINWRGRYLGRLFTARIRLCFQCGLQGALRLGNELVWEIRAAVFTYYRFSRATTEGNGSS